MKLTVATCQFPVSSDIRRNAKHIRRQVREAKAKGAHVVQFPETCLSGYVGVNFPSYDDFDWATLSECTEMLLEEFREQQIWGILGSTHRLTGRHKPHNSLYIINDQGKLVDRYDKMFCAGQTSQSGELAHFSPGDHFTTFTIKGVKCGTLICHEYRYPELYREYKRRKVDLVFHSYHAGNVTPERGRVHRKQIGEDFLRFNVGESHAAITMPSTMIAAAAQNHVWISCSNTSARESCFASFIVRPDAAIVGRLRRNLAGVLITEVDTSKSYYDSTKAWRKRAMNGLYHSGTLVTDPRSRDRKGI